MTDLKAPLEERLRSSPVGGSDLVLSRGPHDGHAVVLPPQQRRQGIKTPLKGWKQIIEEIQLGISTD